MNVKGRGQRLIPEELLKYLEALKNKYPDAVDLVEANPTLEGGEDSLSSVLINGTKYAVGGGDEVTLYDHHIWILSTFSGSKYVCCDILTKDSTPFTVASFLSWLYDNYYRDPSSAYTANGTDNILGIYSPAGSNLEESKGLTYNNLGGTSYLTLTDITRKIL